VIALLKQFCVVTVLHAVMFTENEGKIKSV